MQLDVLRTRLQYAPVDAGVAPVQLQIYLVLSSQVSHLRLAYRTVHLQMIPLKILSFRFFHRSISYFLLANSHCYHEIILYRLFLLDVFSL